MPRRTQTVSSAALQTPSQVTAAPVPPGTSQVRSKRRRISAANAEDEGPRHQDISAFDFHPDGDEAAADEPIQQGASSSAPRMNPPGVRPDHRVYKRGFALSSDVRARVMELLQ
jgi:hypothetical protein